MKPTEILRKTLELLDGGKRWTKYFMIAPRPIMTPEEREEFRKVRDFLETKYEGGNCYCLIGAFDTIDRDDLSGNGRDALEFLRRAMLDDYPDAQLYDRGISLSRFNDQPWVKFDDVKKVLERSIEYAEKEGR